MTLFKVYIDEGGTNAGSPILTVAGYIARPSQWRLFTKEWNRVLRSAGIKIYHATDAQALRKEFKGWTSERVGQLCAELLPIIPKYARGISASIDMREFLAAIGSRPDLLKVFSSPYNACFHWLTMSLVDLADQARIKPRFEFVHETNNMKREALEGFEWVKANSPFGNGHCLAALSFAEKDEFAPLQAADILAFEVNRRLNNLSAPPRRAWLALKADELAMSQFYGKNNMPQLVADLEKISSLSGDLDRLQEFFKQQLGKARQRQR